MNRKESAELTDTFAVENAFYRDVSVTRIGKFVTHLDLFRRSAQVPGEIVECGVFKGSSLFRWLKLRSLLENTNSRKIFAFDVFGEFPEAGNEADRMVREEFVKAAGNVGPSRDELLDSLKEQGLHENIELIDGDICETVPRFVKATPQTRISLLNIDVDLYEPTLCCLENLYPIVTTGGVIILDDYGAFPGANTAIEEFFVDKEEQIQKFPYSFSVSFVVKT